MEAPERYYVTYIAAKPQRIWDALIDPQTCKKFFMGCWMESTWKQGSEWRLMSGDTLDSAGLVLEYDPPRRMTVSWRGESTEELRALPHIMVTIEIEDRGEVSKLTVWECHEERSTDEYKAGGRDGWPVVISGLKTLIETGAPLPALGQKTSASTA